MAASMIAVPAERMLRKALIRAAKTSYTAGTLDEIFLAPHLSSHRAIRGARNLLFYYGNDYTRFLVLYRM
ncbi:MAG: hypothetical protein LBQ30_01660, partial [Treponema sp.]|nr:hypothetical protein [Treponema sp.]